MGITRKGAAANELARIRAEIMAKELGIMKIEDPREQDAVWEAWKVQKTELEKQRDRLIKTRDEYKERHPESQQRKGKVVMATYIGGQSMERYLIKPNTRNELVGKTKKLKFFGPYEVSPWLDEQLRAYGWMDFVTDDVDAVKLVLRDGFGGEYKCLFADWRDRQGTAILVHNSCPFNNLDDMGCETHLDDLSQTMKAAKRIHRLCAPGDARYRPRYGWEQAESWIPETMECVIEMDNGSILIMRYVDIDKLSKKAKAQVDGRIGLSKKAHQVLLGVMNPKIGMSWGITLFSRWMGKGHTMVLTNEDPGVDIVVYGPKKEVGSKRGRFTFLSLGPKHGTEPKTDIQSVTNFKQDKLMVHKFLQYARLVYLSAHNELEFIKVVMKTLRSVEDEGELTDFTQEEKFLLRKAVTNGISPFLFPGLYRKCYRMLLKSVVKLDKWRIPLYIPGNLQCEDADHNLTDYNVAIAKYACGEPIVICEDGSIDMSKALLKDGEICVWDLPANIWVVVYRQPNENPNAWVKLWNVHIPEYKDSEGGADCYLSPSADKDLGRMGGGDGDDNLIIIFDPAWVANFDTLNYDESAKIEPENVYQYEPTGLEEPTYVNSGTYDIAAMMYQIDTASGSELSIGSAVNADLDDLLKSDPVHMASMIAYLIEEEGDPEVYLGKDLIRASDWLRDVRDPNTTGTIAANLEVIIDSATKDASLMKGLNDWADTNNPDKRFGQYGVSGWIAAYHRTQLVYPECLAIPSPGRPTGRIPAKRAELGNYVLAKTEQCKSMDKMRDIFLQLEQKFMRNEWKLVTVANLEVAQRLSPSDPLIKEMVSGDPNEQWKNPDNSFGIPMEERKHPGLRGAWGMEWTRVQKTLPPDARNAAMTEWINTALDQFEEEQPGCTLGIAVELYRQLYATQRSTPPNGAIQSFHDALLWGNRLGNALLEAIYEAKLNGWVRTVALSKKEYKKGLYQVTVLGGTPGTVRGMVYIDGMEGEQVGGIQIGDVDGVIPSGNYTMDDGLIMVDPHPAFEPRTKEMSMERVEGLFNE
jgi:hypothetical protein